MLRSCGKRLWTLPTEPISPPFKMAVGEWLDEWLESYVDGVLAPTTIVNYRQHVKNHIKPALGNVKLEKLDPQAIQMF